MKCKLQENRDFRGEKYKQLEKMHYDRLIRKNESGTLKTKIT